MHSDGQQPEKFSGHRVFNVRLHPRSATGVWPWGKAPLLCCGSAWWLRRTACATISVMKIKSVTLKRRALCLY